MRERGLERLMCTRKYRKGRVSELKRKKKVGGVCRIVYFFFNLVWGSLSIVFIFIVTHGLLW